MDPYQSLMRENSSLPAPLNTIREKDPNNVSTARFPRVPEMSSNWQAFDFFYGNTTVEILI
jgi:hypothetical protein